MEEHPATWSALVSAVASVPVMPLLAAVAEATGDRSVLDPALRPNRPNALQPDGGMTEEQVRRARELALELLTSRARPVDPQTRDSLRPEILAFLIGDEDAGTHGPLLIEELGTEDLRRPTWTVADVAPGRTMTAVVIGAGVSGLLAAHRLQQAGVEVTVFERNDDVGGTWFDNTYPGCRVDVPSHLYSYSCATRAWANNFSTQAEILDYLRRFATDAGIRPRIRFGCEVRSASFATEGSPWTVTIEAATGTEQVGCDLLISAVGQLNRPLIPEIEGLERFSGPAFHSARWDHAADLTGRVGVIGTGASAMQLVPEIAEQAEHLTVFQRSPSWMLPTPGYQAPVPDAVAILAAELPNFLAWHRLWLFWSTHEGLLPATEVDPAWDEPGSISAANAKLRRSLTRYMESQFGRRTDLLSAVTPTYPPLSKRAIRDDGGWGRTLLAPNVELVTDGVDEVVAGGVRTGTGRIVDLDALIFGTGFKASEFLVPMRVVGRDGVDLHEAWDGEARAYLGTSVADFPNLFLLYGPNTNIVINGSVVFFTECEVNYVLECVRTLVSGGHRTIEVTADAAARYDEWIVAGNRRRAWGLGAVRSWYKSASGRVTQNWPYSLLEFWQRTRAVDPADVTLR